MDVIKEPEVFELGLVLAGGVSAGSYTAGVLDFLLQALEAWETQRNQPDVPSHRVQIKVAAGGSAGGIVAAMLARLQHEDFPAVTTTSSEGDKKANKLYDVWVN